MDEKPTKHPSTWMILTTAGVPLSLIAARPSQRKSNQIQSQHLSLPIQSLTLLTALNFQPAGPDS